MNIKLPKPGKYVIAVSGGVDSVVLLHRLESEAGLELVVAHYDHGIRSDSHQDKLFVESLAEKYNLPFVSEAGELGPAVSEATARTARYAFLRRAQAEYNAQVIITAHHQDDVLETAIINILRGTGRRGLSALKDSPDLMRPLLNVPKSKILDYANQYVLTWREDITNTDEQYLRNYVRHKLLPRFSKDDREWLLEVIKSAAIRNDQVDTLLVKYLRKQSVNEHLNRAQFSLLPHALAREIMASWLRSHSINNYDTAGLERLVVAAKTSPAKRKIDVVNGYQIFVENDFLALQLAER